MLNMDFQLNWSCESQHSAVFNCQKMMLIKVADQQIMKSIKTRVLVGAYFYRI